MALESITFGRLDALLTSLGYRLARSANHLAYLSKGRQPIYLPNLGGDQVVPGMSLAAVESTLALDGVIHPEGLIVGLIRAAEPFPREAASLGELPGADTHSTAAKPPVVKRPQVQPTKMRGIK